ncbi:hypothetical protein CERSUDRAFT_61043, partial [Gelatoporia subvermispora B]
VDYVFLSSIVGVALVIVVTYDIACTYFKNFWKRAKSFPPCLQTSLPPHAVIPKVNKAHLVGHGDACQGPFSLNYTTGCGRMNGEGCERCWACLNRAAASVKEMGESARRETLDNFCGYSNWMKTKHPEQVLKWEREVLEWEADTSLPCPYQASKPRITLAKVKAQLAKEEANCTAGGEALQAPSSVAFVAFGLELEDLQ